VCTRPRGSPELTLAFCWGRAATCRLVRSILADKPRVTKFPIEFDAQTIPTMAGMAPEHSMDGLAGDMIDGMQPGEQQQQQQQQQCGGMMGMPPAAGMDLMMEG
jgi:hypothetical protein